MAEEHIINGGGPASSFGELILRAVERIGAVSVCVSCGTDAGWDGWDEPHAPGLYYFADGVAMTTAVITCRRCGFLRVYSLAALGVRLEERRVVPASGGLLSH